MNSKCRYLILIVDIFIFRNTEIHTNSEFYTIYIVSYNTINRVMENRDSGVNKGYLYF